MKPSHRHGCILGGVISTPDLDASLRDYQDILGLTLLEIAPVLPEVAESWGCPNSTGKPMATLQPASGAPCFIRLVEQPLVPGFMPTTTYGWAAFELTVKDVFDWPARLHDSGFDVIGPPKDIPGLPYFVAMQVTGRGKEMLYFNETRSNTPSNDLPFAQSAIDHIFIVILASPDREASVAWYRDRLKLDVGDSYTIPYTMINKAFDLPGDALTQITMVQNGRMPIVEIDEYPPQAGVRPNEPKSLPSGNALVSLAIDNFDALNLDWIVEPQKLPGPIYADARAGTICGPAGELLELIEIVR